MKHEKPEDFYDGFTDDFNVISAQDCTGLIPALPQSDAEWDSYMALYATELTSAVPKTTHKDKDKNP